MDIHRWLFILGLFSITAGFQLFIFAALYTSGGQITLVDPFPELRLFEFVFASAVFFIALLASYDFIVKLIKRRDPFD